MWLFRRPVCRVLLVLGDFPILTVLLHLLHGDRSAGLCPWRGDGEQSLWLAVLRLQCAQPSPKGLFKMQIPRNWFHCSQKVSRVTQGIQLLVVQGSHLEKVCLPAKKEAGEFSAPWGGRELGLSFQLVARAQARSSAGAGWGVCSELQSEGRSCWGAGGRPSVLGRGGCQPQCGTRWPRGCWVSHSPSLSLSLWGWECRFWYFGILLS